MTVFMSVSEGKGTQGPDRPGYALLRAARDVMRVAADAETRQMVPTPHNEIARRLGMKADHLGVVIGLRFKDDSAYRIGLVPRSHDKSADHWNMIALQLKAMGWITADAPEERCVRMMTTVIEEIRTALAHPAS